MREKEIQYRFAKDWTEQLKSILGEDLRLYAFELPVRTKDGTKYADLVFELDKSDNPYDNKMMIIELKKDKIDTGVVDQVLRYSYYTKRQLYRKKKVSSIIAGPKFSQWEIKTCRDNGVIPLQYDLKGNMRVL